MQGTQVRALVGELGSCKLHGEAKRDGVLWPEPETDVSHRQNVKGKKLDKNS